MFSIKNLFTGPVQNPRLRSSRVRQTPDDTWTVKDYRKWYRLLAKENDELFAELFEARKRELNAQHEAFMTRGMVKKARDALSTVAEELDDTFRLRPTKKALDEAMRYPSLYWFKDEAYKEIKKLKKTVDSATARLKSYAGELDSFLK
ncbi:hypothetical protein ACHAPU_003262 [Fusarium lateritium]